MAVNNFSSLDDFKSVFSSFIPDLVSKSVKICVAESLTGGAVSDAIVSIPGVSEIFLGGVISYDSRIKAKLLGVSDDFLASEGAVNGFVATQMAKGVVDLCRLSKDDYMIGLSTTGSAGPLPDYKSTYGVGTYFVGVNAIDSSYAKRFFCNSVYGDTYADRNYIRDNCVLRSLECLAFECQKILL